MPSSKIVFGGAPGVGKRTLASRMVGVRTPPLPSIYAVEGGQWEVRTKYFSAAVEHVIVETPDGLVDTNASMCEVTLHPSRFLPCDQNIISLDILLACPPVFPVFVTVLLKFVLHIFPERIERAQFSAHGLCSCVSLSCKKQIISFSSTAILLWEGRSVSTL